MTWLYGVLYSSWRFVFLILEIRMRKSTDSANKVSTDSRIRKIPLRKEGIEKLRQQLNVC